MFSINYNHTNYGFLLKHLAEKMNAKVKKNFFAFPSKIADGYLKYINLSNGLQCLIVNFKLNQDLYLRRVYSPEEYYILRFDDVTTAKNLITKTNEDIVTETNKTSASVLLTSSKYNSSYVAAKGTTAKSINVLITKEWLSKYLCLDKVDEFLKKHLFFKLHDYTFLQQYIEYQPLINKVLSSNSKDDKLDHPVVKEGIVLMVEKFLHLLNKKFTIQPTDKIKIFSDEVKRLMEVEMHLLKDFSNPPSLLCLSKIAAMSLTTLKNKFKKIYGTTLYNYFQKNRMQRAKDLMQSNKHSIKEVGSQLGYSNLSNFAIAFKKEFQMLPSQFLKHYKQSILK